MPPNRDELSSQSVGSGQLTARQNARLRERLVALCEREGLSKRALALKADISIGAVRSVGTTQAGPRLGTLLALTRALELQSIDQLLGPGPTALLTADDQLETRVAEHVLLALTRVLRLQSIDQLLDASPTARVTTGDELETRVADGALGPLMRADRKAENRPAAPDG